MSLKIYTTETFIARHYSAAGVLEKEIFKTTVNSSRSEYHYDENGNNACLAFYNASGNLTSETVSLYDQNNLLKQSLATHWSEKTAVIQYYLPDGQWHLEVHKDSDGETVFYFERDFDGLESVQRMWCTDSSGTILALCP